MESFTDKLNDDHDDHLHIDPGMVAWLTPESIFLNIRGPMAIWSQERATAYNLGTGALPDGWLDPPYDDEAENMRLPNPVKFRQRWCRA